LTVDVAIVGGGPAGLATAIAAADRGLSVVVCDPRESPIDKGCGEGLMPDAVAHLRGWQVRIPAGDRFPFAGIRYFDGEHRAQAEFLSGAGGWGVRRTALHRAMGERAAAAGVDFRWGTRVEGLESSATGARLETSSGALSCRSIVGADGLHSSVRQWAGLEPRAKSSSLLGRQPPPRFGVRRHYEVAPWSPFVEVYWADHAEAYVTPVSANQIGVAILWSGSKKGFDSLIELFPELRKRLEGHEPASRDRGAGALKQRVPKAVRGSVALVGDAAGYLDAITGEGLAMAFHQAAALGAALADDDLSAYARAHRRLARFPNALIRTLLFVERRPRLRRRVIRTLTRDAELFRRLLAIHAGQAPVHRLLPGGLLRLAAGIASP